MVVLTSYCAWLIMYHSYQEGTIVLGFMEVTSLGVPIQKDMLDRTFQW